MVKLQSRSPHGTTQTTHVYHLGAALSLCLLQNIEKYCNILYAGPSMSLQSRRYSANLLRVPVNSVNMSGFCMHSGLNCSGTDLDSLNNARPLERSTASAFMFHVVWVTFNLAVFWDCVALLHYTNNLWHVRSPTTTTTQRDV